MVPKLHISSDPSSRGLFGDCGPCDECVASLTLNTATVDAAFTIDEALVRFPHGKAAPGGLRVVAAIVREWARAKF